MFIIQNFILLILGCGDHPNRIEEHSSNDHILLGTVNLQNGETYLSCRKLCKDAHPEFQFYHKFINYQSCECKKMTDGVAITLKDHGAYTFGYSTECGTFIIQPNFIPEPSKSYFNLSGTCWSFYDLFCFIFRNYNMLTANCHI